MTKKSDLDFLGEDISEYFRKIHPARDRIPTEKSFPPGHQSKCNWHDA
jgi:hypothetical protein